MIEKLERDLTSAGFVRTQRPAVFRPRDTDELQGERQDLWFFGSLKAARGAVRAYLYIPDLSFVTPPVVLVPERPTWLAGWRPHLREISSAGIEELCFSDHEKFQLLAHAPGPAIFRMIEDARLTLDRIAEPASVLEDSKREFSRLWQSGRDTTNVYLDSPASQRPVQCKSLIYTGTSENPCLFVGENPVEVAKKLGVQSQLMTSYDAMVYPIQADEPLHLTSDGPPGNLLEFANWLKQVAPKTYALWHHQMQSPGHYQDGVSHHFFASGNQFIGYFVGLPKTARRIRSAKEVRSFLASHVYGVSLPIERLHAQRMDEDYLVRRNLEADVPDLRGLQILLIGAGAIGGFLAQNLVQLGAGGRNRYASGNLPHGTNEAKRQNTEEPLAGSPKNGTLHICDRDIFSGGNVGRHVLGTSDVGSAKAEALRAHLERLRPGVSVQSISAGFNTLESQLERYDVIIDATGYETFGRHISKVVRGIGWLQPPHFLLHVWLEGRGGVVRSLAQDKASCACYDCLWNYTPGTEPRSRHPAYSDSLWNVHGDDGYATMTPFSVSAPMAAAALATDALMAWRSGNASPRFRSRSSEGNGINPSVAKDLQNIKGCPGCGG